MFEKKHKTKKMYFVLGQRAVLVLVQLLHNDFDAFGRRIFAFASILAKQLVQGLDDLFHFVFV
jgi:hypothetical protein